MGSNPSQAPVASMEDPAAEAVALYARFQEFAILADPLESPFARQLVADGYNISAVPLSPHRSQTAFLGVRLVWRNLELHLRQPDDSSLLICNIHRSGSNESLAGCVTSTRALSATSTNTGISIWPGFSDSPAVLRGIQSKKFGKGVDL
ncbi:MAG: hypothetical protein NTZ08_14605 [Verrucomicrobia bacterium]|nr:hypothetical protein [Verrucomicrobiota bacterium]